jgi:hypothetical protein
VKIDDYITKHQVSPLVPSLVNPSSLPPAAYSKEVLLPTFAGANSDGTIFVTTYNEKGFFVAYEKGKRRIVGKLSEDSRDLV